MFSVLIPSRNRLNLLKLAVESVRLQDFGDFEIVISDNASDDDYRGYVDELGDARVRYLRSDSPLSVTENWNRALEAAQGDYVVMLGDDDAMAPGYLSHQAWLISAFDRPDVLYANCYHYTYPGVIAGAPDGYLATVDNSVLFHDRNAPYEVDLDWARRLGVMGPAFRHQISFNAQHYMYRRDYILSLADLGPFYQSPYPDYYVSFLTFLTAARIIADPHPRMIIGIAKQSFGFYFMNQREEEGRLQFLSAPVDTAFLSGGDPAVVEAIERPGVAHVRNWLLAALQLKQRLAGRIEVAVDLRRYRRLQTMEMALLAGYETREPRRAYYDYMRGLRGADLAFARRALRSAMTVKRLKLPDTRSIMWGYQSLLNTYHPATVAYHGIPSHQDILDAVRWLALPAEAAPEPEPATAAPSLEEQLARSQSQLQSLNEAHAALARRGDELAAAAEQAAGETLRLAAELESTVRSRKAGQERERLLTAERDELLGQRAALERSLPWRATRTLRAFLARLDRKPPDLTPL
ncbi:MULTISPECIES: glycosyltransferase family 2 protein [unclassified Caulobacter]|uniref:glycosyltransferase family 2 protein n=1 Tax=unclassified Caulobacter TaxID=2648921 RepID=UPI0004A719BF|nr:glycosyltransferase family 2 protein [Caulobacter sp. UNC358MFTsu5.1]